MSGRVNVFTQVIEGHRALVYRYNCGEGMGFRLHLLCDVGEPWQAEAQRQAGKLAKSSKSEIVCVDLDSSPWRIEALIKRRPAEATV